MALSLGSGQSGGGRGRAAGRPSREAPRAHPPPAGAAAVDTVCRCLKFTRDPAMPLEGVAKSVESIRVHFVGSSITSSSQMSIANVVYHTTDCYSATKRNGVLTPVTVWLSLENVTSQRPDTKGHIKHEAVSQRCPE